MYEWRNKAKQRAAQEAVKRIHNGQVVGLGTGSTIYYALEELGRRIQKENLQIQGVSTSTQSSQLATHFRIPLVTLNAYPTIDVVIDGADQVDPKFNLIKGMGGALTREKIVASAATTVIIVVDETKMTSHLGLRQVVPVEVLPFAEQLVYQRLRTLAKQVVRRTTSRTQPYITDNNNYILDVDFGEINAPESLEKQVKSLPGVIEVGLFINMADMIYIGKQTTVEIKQKTRLSES
jgi:ribose 5-phosphate isomerase A